MKLTKAQRLFIKAGEQQAFMKIYSNRGHFRAAHRKERKKLIREALRAYNIENFDAFTAGYKTCDRDHSIAEEFILVDGDIIF
jgi:hypothetical protein